MPTITLESFSLSETEISEIKAASLRILRGDGLEPLSPSVARIVSKALEGIADGQSVGKKETLTTNEAAEYLNVSRPYLYKLLTLGKLRCTSVGSHKRLFTKEVEAYKEMQYRESYAAMQELQDQAQELKLGY